MSVFGYLRDISSVTLTLGTRRGSRLASRLANLYPDRFAAFAFLALPYSPPAPHFDLHAVLENSKLTLGYETHGYWCQSPTMFIEHTSLIELPLMPSLHGRRRV